MIDFSNLNFGDLKSSFDVTLRCPSWSSSTTYLLHPSYVLFGRYKTVSNRSFCHLFLPEWWAAFVNSDTIYNRRNLIPDTIFSRDRCLILSDSINNFFKIRLFSILTEFVPLCNSIPVRIFFNNPSYCPIRVYRDMKNRHLN